MEWNLSYEHRFSLYFSDWNGIFMVGICDLVTEQNGIVEMWELFDENLNLFYFVNWFDMIPPPPEYKAQERIQKIY